MPAIGCGNGGLSWDIVKKTIKEYLSDVDMSIIVYNPVDIKENKGDKMSVNYLVVVESNSKAKTIAGFLGQEYAVKASFGHIRNIKKSYDFKNVLVNGCNPEYENDKDKIKIIKELKDYINKDTIVYLASDEDREGEAISWHLIQALGLDPAKTRRIAFHEVTKPAILHALANPRPLDLLMVNAQRARQV